MTDFTHTGKKIPLAPNKDPDDTLTYGVNWEPFLQVGETIISSSWDVPTGLIGGLETVTNYLTGVSLSGGTLKRKYTVGNTITTSLANVITRSMYILCKNK